VIFTLLVVIAATQGEGIQEVSLFLVLTNFDLLSLDIAVDGKLSQGPFRRFRRSS
jgi:hypothetical protein